MKRDLSLPYSKDWTVLGPLITITPGEVVIRYDYVPQTGDSRWVTLRFARVIAYRYLDETCCLAIPDIINDGLVEMDLDDSAWLHQLKSSRDQFFVKDSIMHEMYGRFDFHHYGLWFSEQGYYEVVAQECEVQAI